MDYLKIISQKPQEKDSRNFIILSLDISNRV